MKRAVRAVVLMLTALCVAAAFLSAISNFAGWIYPESALARFGLRLLPGVFVAVLCAILASVYNIRDLDFYADPLDLRHERWNAQFKGCPHWVSPGLYIVLGYAAVNFVANLILGPDMFFPRIASGHALAFYCFSAAPLYTAARSLAPRRCSKGHLLKSDSKFCGECGEWNVD